MFRRRPRRRQELAEQAEGQTAAGQQDQEDQPVQDDDDPREALEAEGEQEGQGADDRSGHHRLGEHDQVVDAHIPPEPAVDAHAQEGQQLDGHQYGHRQQEPAEGLVIVAGEVAEDGRIGEVIGQGDQHDVEQDLEDPALVRRLDEERHQRFRPRRADLGLVVDLHAPEVNPTNVNRSAKPKTAARL